MIDLLRSSFVKPRG